MYVELIGSGPKLRRLAGFVPFEFLYDDLGQIVFIYRALTRFGTPKIWKNPCYADFFYSVCLFPLRNREFNIPSFVLPGKICDGMKFATKKVEFKKSIL